MSTQEQHPFYFGNNNFHQAFQSGKSKFYNAEEEARWFDAFRYFPAIKPEPLELNPSFQNFQGPPSHFYQQQYQNGFSTAPPQFYFHTQNIIQNNINNRMQNIFANNANVHQDDNNTLVNLSLPGGEVHASMESRTQVDSYYYSATSNADRYGSHQGQSEENAEDFGGNVSKDMQDNSSESHNEDVQPQMDNSTKTIDDAPTNEL